ncbi:MAG: Holliday junction branch migration protein RuvA [Treponema sp.]|nr:Holliday junction branch migration protein RuvA [Treponema sp.]
MFNSIQGVITGKFPKQIFIENNGIEWDICIPDTNLELLPVVGQTARVYTWLNHTDKSMDLYGFATAEERSLFFDLLKVDGIGAKGAVKIMSSVSSSQLTAVLEQGDLARLEKIPGVGKKTAGKMLLALKGKLTLSDTIAVPKGKKAEYADVILSLTDMGYDKRLAEQKIAELTEILSNDESFGSKNQTEKEEIIFRRALIELA